MTVYERLKLISNIGNNFSTIYRKKSSLRRRVKYINQLGADINPLVESHHIGQMRERNLKWRSKLASARVREFVGCVQLLLLYRLNTIKAFGSWGDGVKFLIRCHT
jgi:hypothetical protein